MDMQMSSYGRLTPAHYKENFWDFFFFFFPPQNFSSLSIYNILTTKMNVWFQHCKNTFYLLILALTEYKYIWKGLHGQKASGSVSGKWGKPLFFHAVLVFGSKPAHSTTFSRYAPLHQLNHSALFLMLTTFFFFFFSDQVPDLPVQQLAMHYGVFGTEQELQSLSVPYDTITTDIS